MRELVIRFPRTAGNMLRLPLMSLTRLPDRLIARIAAFSLVGVVNTAVGAGVILVAGVLGAGPILANIFGYAVGLAVSFTLNSRVTFGARHVSRTTIVKFVCAFIAAFLAELSVVKVVTDVTSTHKLIGSLAGMPVYTGLFYLLCEYWVFRRRRAL